MLSEFVLQPGAPLVPGQVYVVLGISLPSNLVGASYYAGDGVVMVAPNNPDIVSVGEWLASIGATSISTCDSLARKTCFADGKDIFEI